MGALAQAFYHEEPENHRSKTIETTLYNLIEVINGKSNRKKICLLLM